MTSKLITIACFLEHLEKVDAEDQEDFLEILKSYLALKKQEETDPHYYRNLQHEEAERLRKELENIMGA